MLQPRHKSQYIVFTCVCIYIYIMIKMVCSMGIRAQMMFFLRILEFMRSQPENRTIGSHTLGSTPVPTTGQPDLRSPLEQLGTPKSHWHTSIYSSKRPQTAGRQLGSHFAHLNKDLWKEHTRFREIPRQRPTASLWQGSCHATVFLVVSWIPFGPWWDSFFVYNASPENEVFVSIRWFLGFV